MLSIADCCVEVRDSLIISTSSWGLSRGGENISSSNSSVSVKSSANIDSSPLGAMSDKTFCLCSHVTCAMILNRLLDSAHQGALLKWLEN